MKMRRKSKPEIFPFHASFWFHCASLGEYEQAVPLMESLKMKYPHVGIVVTFFSPSGYDIKKNDPLPDAVLSLPMDTPMAVKSFLKHFHVKYAFFIKYEFWYHALNTLHHEKIPTFLIAAIVRPEHISGISGIVARKSLPLFIKVFTQDEQSLLRLKQIGINGIFSGDPRMDRFFEKKHQAQDIHFLKKWIGESLVLVAGSTWNEEEGVIEILLSENANLKVILVPHDIHRSPYIGKKLFRFNPEFMSNTSCPSAHCRVFIIDNIGWLFSAYQLGNLALVGGGFTNALHNIIEPSVWGIPVFFGSHHSKYPEAENWIKGGASKDGKTPEKLAEIMLKCIHETGALSQMGEKAFALVEKQRGATTKMISFIANEGMDLS